MSDDLGLHKIGMFLLLYKNDLKQTSCLNLMIFDTSFCSIDR